MKRWIKIVLWIMGTPVVLIAALMILYIISNKQGEIEPFQIGNPNAKHKILVASQGSDFKENLVSRIVKDLESDSVFISVIDCTHLTEGHLKNWDAYILIHTMQIHNMPKEADLFLSKMKTLDKVALVSTSGAGDEHYTKLDVDGISTASRISAIGPIMKWILPRINDNLISN